MVRLRTVRPHEAFFGRGGLRAADRCFSARLPWGTFGTMTYTRALSTAVASLLLALATACGGDGGSSQAMSVASTSVAPSSAALNEQLEELQAVIDDSAAEIDASTDRQDLRKASSDFSSALVDAEARLRGLDVPPDLEDEMSALLGAISVVAGTIGSEVPARLASSSVEETKQFIETYARVDDLRAAIAALQDSLQE